MSEADLNVIFYTLFLLLGLPVSYKYAKFTVTHTGMVLPHFFVSMMLNLCIGTVGIVGWIFFSVRISRAFTIGGIYLGALIISLSLVTLLVLLIVKRKSMIQSFHYLSSK